MQKFKFERNGKTHTALVFKKYLSSTYRARFALFVSNSRESLLFFDVRGGFDRERVFGKHVSPFSKWCSVEKEVFLYHHSSISIQQSRIDLVYKTYSCFLKPVLLVTVFTIHNYNSQFPYRNTPVHTQCEGVLSTTQNLGLSKQIIGLSTFLATWGCAGNQVCR